LSWGGCWAIPRTAINMTKETPVAKRLRCMF
jgi:hypothetical protein